MKWKSSLTISQSKLSKLGYVKTFMKIWEEENLTHFLKHLSPIKTKMKMKMKNFGKMSLIYEFSISNYVGYTEIFMRIWEKNLDSFLKTFLTNRGKNEDEDEKIWENDLNFSILHIKIRLYSNFDVNLWTKNFGPYLEHFFWLIEAKAKMKIKKIGKLSSNFEFWISKYWEISFLSKFLPAKDILGQRRRKD